MAAQVNLIAYNSLVCNYCGKVFKELHIYISMTFKPGLFSTTFQALKMKFKNFQNFQCLREIHGNNAAIK